jgi:hypothetical protein
VADGAAEAGGTVAETADALKGRAAGGAGSQQTFKSRDQLSQLGVVQDDQKVQQDCAAGGQDVAELGTAGVGEDYLEATPATWAAAVDPTLLSQALEQPGGAGLSQT